MPRSLPPARLTELFRYAVVGLSSTVIDFGLLALLTDVGRWHPLAANPLSFVLGVTNGFFWNRHWTFPGSKHEEPIRQYLRFVLVQLFSVLIDQGILATALALGPHAGLSSELSKWTGKIVSIPFIVAWNFTVNSRWTFGKRNDTSVES